MKPNDDLSLIGGGDCHSHTHQVVLSHDHMSYLHSLETELRVTSSVMIDWVPPDFILVDSTAGAITVTLPLANNGAYVTIIRIAGANNVVVNGDNINGSASATITSSFTPLRLKAFSSLGYLGV